MIESFTISGFATIREAMQKINANKARILFVVDKSGHLLGALSDGDIRHYLGSEDGQGQLDDDCLKAANRSPITLTIGDEMSESTPPAVDYIPVLNKNGKVINIWQKSSAEIQVGPSTIGGTNPCFVIAEIGNNHNGSVDHAKELIRLAKASGADAAKFQLRNMSSLYRDKTNQKNGAEDLGVEYTQALLDKYNLPFETLKLCFDYVREQGMAVICTPFDMESLRNLVEYQVDAIKIASADLTNDELLTHAAFSNIPLIVSTGMSLEHEIEHAAKLLNKYGVQFALLHCNSTYPTPFKDVNLNYMPKLGRKSRAGIFGYSGHERGWHVPVAATALGAKVVEKHFTTDKNLEGNDHKVSLLPNEFQAMVAAIRDVEASLGSSSIRQLTQGELINRENLAKSIVAARDLPKGHKITRDDLEIRSPGRGLQPNRMNEVIGQIVSRDIPKHDFIFKSDFTSDTSTGKRDFEFVRPVGIPVRFHDVEIASNSNIDLVEFHLTNADLSRDISDLKVPSNISRITVHAPENFEGDDLLDLASRDAEVRAKSLKYLKMVVDKTKSIKEVLNYPHRVPVIVNVGGFSLDGFIDAASKPYLYELVNDAFEQLETPDLEFIAQTMPPYPWHFGGQSYHNLFVDLEEIKSFCETYGRRICFDISHSSMAAEFCQRPLRDYVAALAKHTAHIHISDAKGLDGEGLQIGDGDINFADLMGLFDRENSEASMIPEIWQGHKESGRAFFEALARLEEMAA